MGLLKDWWLSDKYRKSGTSKEIVNLAPDGTIKHLLIGDFTIYGPPMSPYLVVEVAYSQTLFNIERKVQVWMSISTVVGVIVVQIDEQPPYTFSEYPTNLPGSMREKKWLKVAEKSPKLGPIEVIGLKW